MTLHGVRRWLRGETLPTHEKLLALAEWLAVSPQQLGFGDEVQRKIEVRRARWDSGIGYQDRDIFEAFLKLPVPQRKIIREVILTFAKVHAVADAPVVPGKD
jgi:transcriptional regulator with XRE-family HTH domain